MKIAFDISAVIAGAMVSLLLFGLAGWALIQSNDIQVIVHTSEGYQPERQIEGEEAEAAMSSLHRIYLRIKHVIIPLILLITGTVAGAIGKRWKPALGILAAMPIILFMSANGPSIEYGMIALYCAIAGAGAYIPKILRNALSPHKAW